MSSVRQQRFAAAKATCSSRSRSSLWGLAFILGALMFAGVPNAKAAVVTIDQAGVEGVYNQESFGETSVDILFNPPTTLSDGSFLNITTGAQLDALFALNNGGDPNVISIYFVDTLGWCGGPGVNILGCANINGNDIVVESAFAASGFGTELIAHELGHSLGLGHVGPFTSANLMSPSINGNTDLTTAQVTALLDNMLSPLQGSGSARFFEVTPVAVVPLPPAVLLFVSALLVLFGVHRRKKLSA